MGTILIMKTCTRFFLLSAQHFGVHDFPNRLRILKFTICLLMLLVSFHPRITERCRSERLLFIIFYSNTFIILYAISFIFITNEHDLIPLGDKANLKGQKIA